MAILRTLLASLVLLLAGGAALSAATDRFQAFTTETARRLAVRRHPIQIPPVALQLQSGSRISLADLHGKWLLVDFIYTRCPTYCVALGGEFAQLQDILAKPLAQGKVQLLSVSFDPVHDTPAQLKAYMQHSRDRGLGWIAARPVEPQGLVQLKQAFGITVIADPASGGYTHNAAIHLVDPRGRLVQIFDENAPDLVGKAVLRRLAQ
ncbi:MAG: SCO family protein [Candidimonas sp.]|nr:MAG: SCO family protein [Candidimonas sp.]